MESRGYRFKYPTFIVLLMVLLVAGSTQRCAAPASSTGEAVESFSVVLEEPENGSISVRPAIPDSASVPAGTVLTVTATPDPGYAFDSGFYVIPGRWGRMYHESPTTTFQVVIDQDKSISASFIEEEALEGFSVTHNVVYAKPGAKELKYDVYSPEGADNLPCVVIIHGGGWTTNDEDIMRGLARELVRTGDYVVFSIDYRWLGDLDGDEEPNTMADLIEDVYGAVAHIQEHAREYGGDPTRIALTGDSAGGHLSAAGINMVDMIGDGGFGETPGVYQYRPTYMPAGKSVDQVRGDLTAAIKIAAPSYGVFAGDMLGGIMGEQPEEVMDAVSPIKHIPAVSERAIPQLLLRGTEDFLINHEGVQAYADALTAAGQRVSYIQVEGVGHAFFDWKPDTGTKATFAEYGVPYAAEMKAFFDTVFYPGR